MPNQPAQATVTISFTLPRALAEAVAREARLAMANKSDIVRRALMAWLSPEERDAVLREIAQTKKKPKS
jgi:Arc/MetJ-type ribon-helix-helix transcriptional regulator